MNKRDQKSGHRWLMVVVLWVPLIFTLSLVFWAQQSQHARDANAKLILHTVQVKEQLEHLDILIGDVETSQRGYLLTGNKVFLDLYGEAVKGIPAQSQNLALLIADNPKQVAPFTKLQAIIADKLAKAAQSISLAEQGNIFDAVQIVKAADEKPYVDEVDLEMNTMDGEENRLLKEREDAFSFQVKSQKNEMIILISVEVALIVGITLFMQHLQKLRRSADSRMDEAHAMTDQAQASTLKAMARTEQAEARAGEAISESESAADQIAEQAALLDEAQDAIIVRNLEGNALFWNKGAERMYGWTRQEVLGLNMSEVLFVQPEMSAEASAVTISQGKWSGDLQHLTKDRREITIEARWTLIRDNEGHPKSILTINTDITDKKKIEAQFMRAQRMESIGTLAGGIAHDLNNILAPIMMSIGVLKLTATDPQAKSILDTIEVSSKRGSDIVRQVLSFARGLEGERVEIQPSHLLKDLKSIIKDTFPKNIRLQFSIPNETWSILGDPTQIHQILLNLCVNARDAMPKGGDLNISVENCVLDEHYVAMHIDAKAGRYIKISVTDSGTGIPQGILDKIFEPFFTTKELHEGTGLGLSTVQAIVKSHEGLIDVYSEPGKGTTFKVYLPAMELSIEAQMKVTQQIRVPNGNGETILVVDDEASLLTITSQTLQAFGYRVLTASDGAEAVAVYVGHKSEIAAVLTDMSMPIMDGAAVIRALIKINPAVKIIAASGLHANGDVVKASGGGIKHFLTKPYTSGTLLKTIRVILNGT